MSLSDTVLSIVRQTRNMTLPHYGLAAVEYKKTDGAHDVVTKVDKDVELFLAERLKAMDPSIAFKGEEFGGNGDASRFWLCDPIDGTAHFVRGMPFCTTMLALIEDGIVTFAVIYDFVNDIMYHAERGKGAFRDGAPIRVSERPMQDAYLSVETHAEREANTHRYVALHERAGLIHIIGCGWEFAMVASGKFEGRISFDSYASDWDYAPGSLLVSEAGGVVANIGVRTYDYRNHDFIAANKQVYEALTAGPDAIFPV